MKKKILIFSIDRLGDYLIRSNVIYKLSKNFDFTEIVASDKNFELLNLQSFFDKVHRFNAKNKILEKFIFVKSFLFKSYDTVIVFDGKNISNLLLFLIKAKFKFTFIYKKKKNINKINFFILKLFYYIFNIKYVVLNNRYIIEKGEPDNYPLKYLSLSQFFKNIDNKTYYLEKNNTSIFSNIKNSYIVIHLDEKYNDIIDIHENFDYSLKKFSRQIDKKLIITSYNNNYNYYKNLDILKRNSSSFSPVDLEINKMIIIENLKIDEFQDLIENSYCNISCHSGYFVHTSLAFNNKTLDIINHSDLSWLQTWVNYKKNYKIIFKSKDKHMINIGKILELVKNEI